MPFPPPGDLPDPRIEPTSLVSPALGGRLFTTSTAWKAFSSIQRDHKISFLIYSVMYFDCIRIIPVIHRVSLDTIHIVMVEV